MDSKPSDTGFSCIRAQLGNHHRVWWDDGHLAGFQGTFQEPLYKRLISSHVSLPVSLLLLHFFPYPKQNMRLIIREDYEEVSSYIGMYMQDVSCIFYPNHVFLQ